MNLSVLLWEDAASQPAGGILKTMDSNAVNFEKGVRLPMRLKAGGISQCLIKMLGMTKASEIADELVVRREMLRT